MTDDTAKRRRRRSLGDVKEPADAANALNRRDLLQGALGISVVLAAPAVAGAKKPANKMRPQAGDILAHRFGELKGEPVLPAHVPSGAELLQAVGKDPATGVLRDGSRLNGVNVVRLEPGVIDEKTRPFTLQEGIVAYSSVCTHQGCDLTQWLPDTRTFKCYCHYSEFNAAEFGKPIHGPAKRRLAILPIKLENAQIVVADPFVGKVGFSKKQF